ncbi:hypothetical protein SprV_0702398700 [Sparganum proliferum]
MSGPNVIGLSHLLCPDFITVINRYLRCNQRMPYTLTNPSSTITLEGKTLKQVDKGDKLMTMESVVEGNTLTMTARLEELVCVRHYTRI